jgi:NAD(P)-dependent dehydrogenase (short-subunit alcohol dehydrogenase family)
VGAAVTTALAKSGVDIVFCDIAKNAIEATTAEVERIGGRVIGCLANAFDPDQLAAFYSTVDEHFDHLDILVNVVGGVRQLRFADAKPDDWNADIHRNLGWVMHSINLAIPRLRASRNGASIISFTTIEAHRGCAGFAAYAAAKAGLAHLTRALAVELGSERIRANVIAPDTTPSATSRGAVPEETVRALGADEPALLAKSFEMYIPQGTPPPADSLGDAVLFLASDLSSSITGTTLHVDGGTWAASGFVKWPDGLGWGPTPPPRMFR